VEQLFVTAKCLLIFLVYFFGADKSILFKVRDPVNLVALALPHRANDAGWVHDGSEVNEGGVAAFFDVGQQDVKGSSGVVHEDCPLFELRTSVNAVHLLRLRVASVSLALYFKRSGVLVHHPSGIPFGTHRLAVDGFSILIHFHSSSKHLLFVQQVNRRSGILLVLVVAVHGVVRGFTLVVTTLFE